MSELRFDGRVVAITGAAQNMGREYALLLAARGAKVVVNDIKGAGETVADIAALGGEAIENRSDVSDPAGTDAIVSAALEAWGRLDAVIPNAAVYGGSLPDAETTARILGVHLVGTFNVVRSALPVFRRQKYGRILNVGSGSMFGLRGMDIYSSAKSGVFGFTRSLAKDLAADPAADIKVNVILPIALPSGMLQVPDPAVQAFVDKLTCANIASLAAVLVHEACPAHGEAFHVGAGRYARVVLNTSAGWLADDTPTPEAVLQHWGEIVAGRDQREPAGSLADLLTRAGLPDYSTLELREWTQTGNPPKR
jgi:NAD(P)-dependent dehydrogenase (short-subunit alcohol dehydrogenase family)